MEKFRTFFILLPQDKVSEESINDILQNYNMIKKFFYALSFDNKTWNVLIQINHNFLTEEHISRWFKISPRNVKGQKGYHAFTDTIEFILNLNVSNKRANFDWKKKLYLKNRQKIKQSLSPIKDSKYYQYKVQYDGFSLNRLWTYNFDIYSKETDLFNDLRISYLSFNMKKPNVKINLYVNDLNKLSLFLKKKAKLFNLKLNTNRKNVFEVSKDSHNLFSNYDGQSILLWKDFNLDQLIDLFNSKDNLIKVLSNDYNEAFFDKIPTFNTINVFYEKTSSEQFILDPAIKELFANLD